MKTVYMQGSEWIGETGEFALAGTYVDLPEEKALDLLERNAALECDVVLKEAPATLDLEATNVSNTKRGSKNRSNGRSRKPRGRKTVSKT